MSTPQKAPTAEAAQWLQVVIEAAKLKLLQDDRAGRPHNPDDVRLANAKVPTAKAS